jgi:V/A-type H+-transporting ATPase subunit D
VAEPGADVATRVALLELRDERRLVQEGYDLLDEKRVMLATEALRRLREHDRRQPDVEAAWSAARDALRRAIAVHGFDELTVQPPCSLDSATVHAEPRKFLGIALVDARLETPPSSPTGAPVLDTPELRQCAVVFRRLTVELFGHAARAADLRRLVTEYRRTERRACALENVLLPEIDRSLRYIEEQLDAVDQEEAVRVRNAGNARPK